MADVSPFANDRYLRAIYGGTWREMADIVGDGVRTTMLPLADPTTLLAEWLGDPAFPDSLDVACFAAAVAIELGDTAALRRLLPHLRRAATVESWMDAVRIRDLVSTAERSVAG